MWIGTRSGPAFIGKAEIVQDTAVQDMMLKEIPKKFLGQDRIGRPEPSEIRLGKGRYNKDHTGERPAGWIPISAGRTRAGAKAR